LLDDGKKVFEDPYSFVLDKPHVALGPGLGVFPIFKLPRGNLV